MHRDNYNLQKEWETGLNLVAKGLQTLPTGYGVGKYKNLKKRMSKDFKAIKKSCTEEQTMPESDLLERFYQDSKTMCTYLNKGEEFYERYLVQVGLLYEAFKASDLIAMKSTIESLRQIRDDCHDRHK